MSYAPTLGRFIQRDPLGYVDGKNLYQYQTSSPCSSVDPAGWLSDEDRIYLEAWEWGMWREQKAGHTVAELFMWMFIHPGLPAVFGPGDAVTAKIRSDPDFLRAFGAQVRSGMAKAGIDPCSYCCLAEQNGGTIRLPNFEASEAFTFSANVDLAHALHQVNMAIVTESVEVSNHGGSCEWSVRAKVTITDRYDFHAGALGLPINPIGGPAANDLGANLQDRGLGHPFDITIIFRQTLTGSCP